MFVRQIVSSTKSRSLSVLRSAIIPTEQNISILTPKAVPIRIRSFSSTTANMVKVGDSIPDVEVFEDSPGNKINLSKELASGEGLIIGVPAAFSPGCSDSHIPGYLTDERLKDAGKVFIVSVNDAFVMKAWGKTLDADKSSGVRFVGDASGEFARAWDVEFDASAIMGNKRSKRYAAKTKDGKVTKVSVEPDNIGINESAADKFL